MSDAPSKPRPIDDPRVALERREHLAEAYGGLTLRMTDLGEDIVVRGAAVLVLSRQLGVS